MRFGAAHVLARALKIGAMQCAGMLRLSARLPPGSLGPRGIARFGNQSFYVRAFQRYGPVFKVLWNRNLTICIVGFERARRLLAIHGHALAQLTIDITPLVPMGFLRGMGEEQHQRYRTLILPALRNDLAVACGGSLRELIRNEFAELARCADETGQGNRRVLTPCLHRVATRGLLLAFFGERPGDGLFASLERGFDSLSTDGAAVHIGDAQRRGFADVQACIRALLERRRSTNRSQVCVLDRLSSRGDERAIDDTMIGNLIYMVELGRYDIRSLLRWVIKHLSVHPTADVSLARACILETLRLEQVDALSRIARVDFEFDGYRIPAGAAVRVLLRESHRDPEAFESPDAYRPCRFATRPPPSRNYAPFGLGEHRCVAAEFVLDFATMCVEELLGGFTWTVVRDGPSEKLSHTWEPANSFEIALRPRGA